MQELFNKIITREIPAHIIWEDESHIAFLDIKPIQNGHTLVVPKKQSDYLFEMSDTEYKKLMLAAKQVAMLIKGKLSCARVCVMVEGYSVPHTHIHLIPTNSAHDLNKEFHVREPSNNTLLEIKNKILS